MPKWLRYDRVHRDWQHGFLRKVYSKFRKFRTNWVAWQSCRYRWTSTWTSSLLTQLWLSILSCWKSVIHFIVQPFHIRCVFLLGDSPKFSIHLSWRICCCGAFDQLHLERDLSVYADPERLFVRPLFPWLSHLTSLLVSPWDRRFGLSLNDMHF